MATEEYSIFSKSLRLELHHQLQFGFISRILTGVVVLPQQRCSRCILQPQPTGLTVPYIKAAIASNDYSKCYIIYDMDFRFVPSDPGCFDKLSRCDKKTRIWQHTRALGYNRGVTGRKPRDENHAVRFGQSAENGSRAWDTQLIRSSLTSLQGGASVGTPWLPEEDMRRIPLSGYISLHLTLN